MPGALCQIAIMYKVSCAMKLELRYQMYRASFKLDLSDEINTMFHISYFSHALFLITFKLNLI